MKVSIKKSLYVGFAIAILLVLLVGSISFNTFQRQGQEAELVKYTYRIINNIEGIQKVLVDMETGRRGFRSTNEKKFLEPYYIGLQTIRPLEDQMNSLLKDDEGQLRRAGEVHTRIAELLAFWSSLGEDASQYDRARIIAINTEEKVKMDQIRSQLEKMEQEQQLLLTKREKENNYSIRLAKWQLGIGIGLILLVVLLLIGQIVREFRNRKKAEVGLQTSNEELLKINEENAERNWLLTGLANVNDVLQHYTNAPNLSEKVLEQITKHLELQAAAVYLYNEESKKLVLTASVAVPVTARKEYELNEGFVGQAGADKRTITLSNLPPSYATVEGGVIAVDPVYAIYTPLIYEDELKGVIETLCINRIGEKAAKFLKLVSNNISVAVHSVHAREKVLQLLKQVQDQKNALEHQQEELRQANEELTVQAEVLQASEEELRVQEEELRQINDELKQKNDAIESARNALVVKAKELEETSRFKSEFLANMSHELRTPLNSVLILAKLLSDNKEHNLTEKQVAHARIIHKSGSDLLQLINDILDLSKIESGKVEVYLEDIPVANISNDLEQLFTVVAEEKAIDFTITIDKDVPEKIKTDKQKVEQILKNLLSNAFKFTPEKGAVSLHCTTVKEDERSYISFSVKDTGIGIPEEKQKVIFEAFQQADGATNRKYGGTGLGLSITRELVRMLQGRVTLQSKQQQGSNFTVLLPMDIDVNSAPLQNQVPIIKATDTKDPVEQTKIADDRSTIAREDKVMLIIEDDPDFAFLMKDFARTHGYRAIVALSGDEGLFCARRYKPSAIILDMGLPVYNGQTLLKIFKNDPELKHIPVHIISGAEEEKDSSGAALAFLRKPVEKKDLEKAFTLIGEYLKSAVKRVLILSKDTTGNKTFQRLISEKNYDVVFDAVLTETEVMDKLKTAKYDCFIADIGSDINAGISQLTAINAALRPNRIPTIIYLDSDITVENEMALKKLSDVVVRKSSLSNNRLIDELELFLYKVQENNTRPQLKLNASISGDETLQKKKVLLVDDDMRNIFALSAVLEEEQMKVLTASDGREALDVLSKNKDIDIVLMDVMMPELDGYDTIRYIRNKMNLATLPVIALTAKAMAGDREKCIEAGASDYISKPVETQKLISLMRVWLS